eukprot:TRINITY_DN57569_c0_g1_i1.p1 TRINITY_DN57569_c0_g1~~TRINITY_DN57569_c0_g1_i1.p1  ORF type:complete len:186 (-),score=44.74 TRINITY_DN57569_c0_g1_i1:116-673(-)
MEVDEEGDKPIGHPAPGSASNLPPAAVDDDSDDDWNPVVQPGIVLRPHVLKWTPAEKQKDDEDEKDILGADPLHDPRADDDDEKWVAEKLLQPDQENVRETDAVLNCPGCFMPVCYQCQKHATYSRQWRATDVRNCEVDRSTSLSVAKDDPTKYFAVRCEACKADVGLLDPDGIYHLFHVLESSA